MGEHSSVKYDWWVAAGDEEEAECRVKVDNAMLDKGDASGLPWKH